MKLLQVNFLFMLALIDWVSILNVFLSIPSGPMFSNNNSPYRCDPTYSFSTDIGTNSIKPVNILAIAP
jgi:hypothetical protein